MARYVTGGPQHSRLHPLEGAWRPTVTDPTAWARPSGWDNRHHLGTLPAYDALRDRYCKWARKRRLVGASVERDGTMTMERLSTPPGLAANTDAVFHRSWPSRFTAAEEGSPLPPIQQGWIGIGPDPPEPQPPWQPRGRDASPAHHLTAFADPAPSKGNPAAMHLRRMKLRSPSASDVRGPNPQLAQAFAKARTSLVELWDRLAVPEEERHGLPGETTQPTPEGLQKLNDEIQRLLDRRQATFQVEKAIEVREAFLYLMMDLSEQAASNLVAPQKLNRDTAQLVPSFRLASLAVVEAVSRWRLAVADPKALFVWKGANYLLKMQRDTAFLAASPLAPLLDAPVANNPFLFAGPTQDMSDDPSAHSPREALPPGVRQLNRSGSKAALPPVRLKRGESAVSGLAARVAAAERVLQEEASRPQGTVRVSRRRSSLPHRHTTASRIAIPEDIAAGDLSVLSSAQISETVAEEEWLEDCASPTPRRAVRAALRIQALWRGFCDRQYVTAVTEQRRAAVKIQTLMRRQLSCADAGRRRREVAAARRLQATTRGMLARSFVHQLRVEESAATRIQSAWRGCLGRQEARRRRSRRCGAVAIQRLWRGFYVRGVTQSSDAALRYSSAIQIQRVWRGHAVRRRPEFDRDKRRAAAKLQVWLRGILAKDHMRYLRQQHRAARSIEAGWRAWMARKQVKVLKARRRELGDQEAVRAAHAAALSIQRVWRGAVARTAVRIRRRTDAAATILRVARGFSDRLRLRRERERERERERRQQHTAAVAIQTAARSRAQALAAAARPPPAITPLVAEPTIHATKQVDVREKSTRALQRFARQQQALADLCRRRADREAADLRREHNARGEERQIAAVMIQCVARCQQARRAVAAARSPASPAPHSSGHGLPRLELSLSVDIHECMSDGESTAASRVQDAVGDPFPTANGDPPVAGHHPGLDLLAALAGNGSLLKGVRALALADRAPSSPTDAPMPDHTTSETTVPQVTSSWLATHPSSGSQVSNPPPASPLSNSFPAVLTLSVPEVFGSHTPDATDTPADQESATPVSPLEPRRAEGRVDAPTAEEDVLQGLEVVFAASPAKLGGLRKLRTPRPSLSTAGVAMPDGLVAPAPGLLLQQLPDPEEASQALGMLHPDGAGDAGHSGDVIVPLPDPSPDWCLTIDPVSPPTPSLDPTGPITEVTEPSTSAQQGPDDAASPTPSLDLTGSVADVAGLPTPYLRGLDDAASPDTTPGNVGMPTSQPPAPDRFPTPSDLSEAFFALALHSPTETDDAERQHLEGGSCAANTTVNTKANAVMVIQRAARVRQATRLVARLRQQRAISLATAQEVERAAEEHRAAGFIQRAWATHRQRRTRIRLHAVLTIQAAGRGFLGRQEALHRRPSPPHVAPSDAAMRIQRAYRSSKARIERAYRAQLARNRRTLLAEECAALYIQCAWRRSRAKMEYHRRRQMVVRKLTPDVTSSNEPAGGGEWEAAKMSVATANESHRQRSTQSSDAAKRIQRLFRRHLAATRRRQSIRVGRIGAAAASQREERTIAATEIQRIFRGHQARVSPHN